MTSTNPEFLHAVVDMGRYALHHYTLQHYSTLHHTLHHVHYDPTN